MEGQAQLASRILDCLRQDNRKLGYRDGLIDAYRLSINPSLDGVPVHFAAAYGSQGTKTVRGDYFTAPKGAFL